jgi:UDP-N-acetylmuramoylalanine-D-glutamate ligase
LDCGDTISDFITGHVEIEMSKRVVILGAGESGTGAAILAKAKGYNVFVSDLNVIKEKYKEELKWESNSHHRYKRQNHYYLTYLSFNEIGWV